MNTEFLTYVRNAGETRRFHTQPVLRVQNDAEHQWHVAWIVCWLSASQPRVNLVMAALAHDMAEHKFGDIPAPAKLVLGLKTMWDKMEDTELENNGILFELNAEERRLLKLADATEGALYCIRERAMGNQLIEPAFRNFLTYMGEVLDHNSRKEETLFGYVCNHWSEANRG